MARSVLASAGKLVPGRSRKRFSAIIAVSEIELTKTYHAAAMAASIESET